MARYAPTPATDTARFWKKVDKSGGEDACWFWTASRSKKNYGYFYCTGRMAKAHRVAYIYTHGPLPDGLDAMHLCDDRYPIHDITYRACCNPAHLTAGTKRENSERKEALGRGNHPSGDRSGARLHPETRARGPRNGAYTQPEKRVRLKGEANGAAKLTEEHVRAIRRLWQTGHADRHELACRFGVTPQQIQRIGDGEAWKHVV